MTAKEQKQLAGKYGWTHEIAPDAHNPIDFYRKKNERIWKVIDWIRATKIDGCYEHHQKFKTFEDALKMRNGKKFLPPH